MADSAATALEPMPTIHVENLEEHEKQWAAEQLLLKKDLVTTDATGDSWNPETLEGLERIAGVDISFLKGSADEAVAALVVLSFPDFKVLYEDCTPVKMKLPYISGFLGFREVPHILQLIKKLEANAPEMTPQCIVVDGNGMLHTRGFGLACHLGVLADYCTIGIGKTLMHADGIHTDKVRAEADTKLLKAGDAIPLVGDSGQTWGSAMRSCNNTINPIFVSIGHRVSLETCNRIISKCCLHRVPEPVRQADIRSRQYLRDHPPPAPVDDNDAVDSAGGR